MAKIKYTGDGSQIFPYGPQDREGFVFQGSDEQLANLLASGDYEEIEEETVAKEIFFSASESFETNERGDTVAESSVNIDDHAEPATSN